jgi:hypothetical protein
VNAAVATMHYRPPEEDHPFAGMTSPLVGSMILSFALLLTLISYPVMKWYIRKLYGQHLEKLKDCLKELEEVA